MAVGIDPPRANDGGRLDPFRSPIVYKQGNDLRHYVSPDQLAVLGGGWAIFAIWVTLDKGMDALLAREPAEIAWSLIGMSNLVGVLLFFVHLRE